MSSSNGTNLKIRNQNARLELTGSGTLTSSGIKSSFDSSGLFNVQSGGETNLSCITGNTTISNEAGSIDINAKGSSANAIFIQASGTTGGAQFRTGSGGTYITSTGDIDMLSTSSNINIGSATQTQSINFDSISNINLETEDISIIASDTLSLISQSGDIQLGTSTSNPVIKFEDGNLLINQSTSTEDHQLDVAVKDASSQRLGYNGMLINTSNTAVAGEVLIQTSNALAKLSMGTHPSTSNYSYYNEYLAYQYSNAVVRLSGPEFTTADLGRPIYWTSTGRRDTIQSIGKLVVGNSDTTNITVTGTYTGSTSKNYLIQIDSNVGTNTFRWSSDGGITFNNKFVNITYSTSNVVSLDNGLSVTFTSNTGFNLHQQMSFMAKVTANVSSTSSISTPELMYTLQPYHSYLGTETATDLVIKTNNTEKIRLTGDGSIAINKTSADAEFHINSNYNRSLLVNESLTGNQINPSIDALNTGGYVIVWESENTDGSGYGIYAQRYMTNGTKIGNNFKVNVTTSNNQSNPDVAHREADEVNHFIIVWSHDSSGSGNYDIYCQIYKDGTAIQSYDIEISTNSDIAYEQLYPRAAGLTNGNYIVVWSADTDGNNQNNVLGQRIDSNGNLVGGLITIDNSARSQNFPAVAALSDNDPTAPGGFVVGYMTETSNDDDRFTINFRVYDSSGSAVNDAVNVTTVGSAGNSSISDGLVSVDALEDGGFIIFFYRNYEADTSLYSDDTNVTGVTSSASGIIDSRNNSANQITLRAISGTFLVGEEISIVDSDTYTEKITAITTLTATTAILTLSTEHKEVYAYKFNSNATLVSNAVWNKRINTTDMYEDNDRKSLPYNAKNRSMSIYNYRRPHPSVVSSFDNGNAMFVWTNGTIPNLYYQIVSLSDGTFIGNEEQFGREYRGLKQRNPVVTNLKSIQGVDYGYVVAWDNTGAEYDSSGIYQQLIGYNHNYLKIEDGYSKMTLDHTGKLGLGTFTPTSTLHIKPNAPTKYNDFNETCTLALQNTASHIITNEDQQKILFQDGAGTTLAQIRGSHSLYYDDFLPNGDNLLAYYKFDESSGPRVVDSSTSSNVFTSVESVGALKNFDLEQCWQPGLINNCLQFDGINNYVQIHDDALSGLNTVVATNSPTFNFWIKIPTYIKEGDNVIYDIISNIDDSDIDDAGGYNGLYAISLVEQSNSGNLNLRTQVRTTSSTTVTGSTTVNTGSWVMITVIISGSETITQYVNGTQDGTGSISGTFVSSSNLAEQTIYIGTRDGSNNFFRGQLDEFRVYSTALTTAQITKLYNYGSKTRGSIIFNAKDDNSYFNKEKSLILDHDGKLANARFKPAPYSLLTGTLTYYNSNITVTGASTLFTKELSVGDIININNTNYPVTSITSDTSLTINEKPLGSLDPSSTSEQSVIRKAPAFSSVDKDNNLVCYTDDDGNTTFGNHRVESRITVSGTGSSASLPYITLVNTTDEDTDGGRESKIIFKGNNGGTYTDLVRLESSHMGVGDDTKGQFKIITNNGTDMNNVAFNIVSNGSIGIGNVDTPPKAELHCRNNNGQFNLLLESQSNPASFTNVFSERSAIYFGGVTSISDNSNSLNSNCLVSIQGSGDSATKNHDGRLDFLTNNESRNNNTMEKRMSITSVGNVGVSIYKPRGTLHVAPEVRNSSFDINTISNYTGQDIQLDPNTIFSDSETRLKLIGGTAVIGNAGLTSHNIESVTTSNIVVAGDISSTTNGDQIFVHYPGLNVVSNGYVGVGTSDPKSLLHVEGSVGTAIKTVTADYTITVVDHTILGNPGSEHITVKLPINYSGIKGRIYIIKNISSSYNVVINGNGTEIDGSSTSTLSTQYKYKKVQSDGTNWYIIGEN